MSQDIIKSGRTSQTIATTTDLPPGGRKCLTIGGIDMTLLNVGGEYYGVKNACPHMQNSIGQGRLGVSRTGQPTIECPFHSWTFELASGERTIPPVPTTNQLDTYELGVVGEEIRIELDDTGSPKRRTKETIEKDIRCPNCGSFTATSPVIAVGNKTLWRCAQHACSTVRWTRQGQYPGLKTTPDLERVLTLLSKGAIYDENEDLMGIAADIATLYRDAGMIVPQTHLNRFSLDSHDRSSGVVSAN